MYAQNFTGKCRVGAQAHASPDAALAAVYGWVDCTWTVPDDEILRRLLALNPARSGGAAAQKLAHATPATCTGPGGA